MAILAQAQLTEALSCIDSLLGTNSDYANSLLGTAIDSAGNVDIAGIVKKLNDACKGKSALPSLPKIGDVSKIGDNLSKQITDTITKSVSSVVNQTITHFETGVKEFNAEFFELKQSLGNIGSAASDAGSEIKNVFSAANKAGNETMQAAKSEAKKDEISDIAKGSIDASKSSMADVNKSAGSASGSNFPSVGSAAASVKSAACHAIGGLNSLLNEGGNNRLLAAVSKFMNAVGAPIDALYKMGQTLQKLSKFTGELPNPANSNPCLALVQDVLLNGTPKSLCQMKTKYGQNSFKFGFATNVFDKLINLLNFIKAMKDKIIGLINDLLSRLNGLLHKFPLCDKTPINLVKQDLHDLRNMPKEIHDGYKQIMDAHNNTKSSIFFENWVLSTEDHNKLRNAFKFDKKTIDDYNYCMKFLLDLERAKSLDYCNKSHVILNFNGFDMDTILKNSDTVAGQCFEGVGYVPNPTRNCKQTNSLLLDDRVIITGADAYGADYLYGNLLAPYTEKCDTP